MIDRKQYKRIWSEDDATPGTEGHVTLDIKWRELFGEQLVRNRNNVEDYGDYFLELMPNGYVVEVAYDGHSIYKPLEKLES